MMEALMDTQNFGGYNITPLPLFVQGIKMDLFTFLNLKYEKVTLATLVMCPK